MITITPIIDINKETNFVDRVGSTGSMVANQVNDIWGAVGLLKEKLYVPYVSGDQPQGVTMYISCDNNLATNQIYISGLDANGFFVDEIITLEGFTKKPLQNLYFRVFQAINLGDAITPGTPPDLKNVVYVYRNSAVVAGKPSDLTAIETIIGSTTTHSLPESQMTQFTVPFNMRGHISKFTASLNFEVPDKRGIFYLMVSPAGREIPALQSFYWTQKQIFALNTSGISLIDIQDADRHNLGIPLDPGDDVVMKAFVTAGTQIVSASITIRLDLIR